MVVYSLAGFPEYIRTAKKVDAATLQREILAACQRPLTSKKNKKRKQSYGKKQHAGTGGMGTSPKFGGRFLRTMVDFFTGKVQPEADTIGKYLTPWARAIAIVEECDDFDELKEKLQCCIDLIPDTSFSDRLSDNPGELERVIEYTLKAILKDNGYQARPDESTAIFLNLKKLCNRIGFVPSDPTTWDALSKPHSFEPTLQLVWTPELVALVREVAPVLQATASQAKELLKLVYNWIEARSEMAYSIVASLMNRVGIKGHNNNVAAFLATLKQQGFIEKAKNYGNFQGADGKVRKHGNFYVNTAKVLFREQIVGEEAMDQPRHVHTLYLLYLSFLSSDFCEILLEHRRLNVEERYARRVVALFRQKRMRAA
jgi:hypothetical protein